MVSAKDLELKLQDLYKKKKYSEIIFQITSKTTEEERNAGLFVLLGISRMSLGLKDKNQVSLAVQDFKKGYLKEQNGVNGLNALTNFVLASSILSDFENTNVDFDEIKSFYQVLPKPLRIKDQLILLCLQYTLDLVIIRAWYFILKKLLNLKNLLLKTCAIMDIGDVLIKIGHNQNF